MRRKTAVQAKRRRAVPAGEAYHATEAGSYMQDKRPQTASMLQMKQSIHQPGKLQPRRSAVAAQLKELRFKPKGTPGPNLHTLQQMAGAIDAATMAGFRYVVDKLAHAADPSNDDKIQRDDFPFCSDNRFVAWIKALGGRGLPAAQTGYMIEDYVTSKFQGADGFVAQYVTGNARPDFKISDGMRQGVVDVTSSGEAGHVLNKKFRIGSFAYVSESVYPSIDFSNYQNTPVDMTGDTGEIIARARRRRARQVLEKNLTFLRNQVQLIVDAGTMLHTPSELLAAQGILRTLKSFTRGRMDIRGMLVIDKKIARYNHLLQKKHGPLRTKVRQTGKLKLRFRTRNFAKGRLRTVRSIINSIRVQYGLDGYPPTWD